MLREIRTQKGFSLLKMYKLTDIDPATLSRLERGLIPAYPKWKQKLSEVLETPIEVLFPDL